MRPTYPLMWPADWPRTELRNRVLGKPHLWRLLVNDRREPWTLGDTRAGLLKQLDLLGASDVVINSNFQMSNRGQPFAEGRRPADQAIAAYFKLDGVPMVMARDPYLEAEANMRALTLSILALRSIELHGGTHMMHRALAGFVSPMSNVKLPAQASMASGH